MVPDDGCRTRVIRTEHESRQQCKKISQCRGFHKSFGDNGPMRNSSGEIRPPSFSGFWNEDILSVEEEPEWEDEGFTAEGLNEEGQALYGEAAQEIQEAQAVMQQAKRTLRDARARQHQVRLSRQYYKTSYSKGSTGDRSYRPRSDQGGGKDSCLRCGKPHRTSECPDRQPTAGKPGVGQGNLATEEAPFVCFTEESALSIEGGNSNYWEDNSRSSSRRIWGDRRRSHKDTGFGRSYPSSDGYEQEETWQQSCEVYRPGQQTNFWFRQQLPRHLHFNSRPAIDSRQQTWGTSNPCP